MKVLRGALAAGLCWLASAALAQERVAVPSLDRTAGATVVLSADWFAAPGAGARPAIVLLHGCGGAFDARGRLSARMREYAALFNAEGWHALVLDSLTARGERELCTQKIGTRRITQAQRRLDALGALQWLAARGEVDAARLSLVGWSNGGSTVLAATNHRQRDVAAAKVTPRVAVAFYPGCDAELARGHDTTAPLLLLVGASDDWTPAAPCIALAERGGTAVRSVVYPGAFHGFDGTAPLRVRREVPGGVNPGQGVTVGGSAVAREASQREMLLHLQAHLAR
jgi:dienelactone hydrolase